MGPLPRFIHTVKFIYPHARYNSYERSPEGLSMPARAATTDLPQVGQRLLWFLLLSSALGCCHEPCGCHEGLIERILPPLDFAVRDEHPSAKEKAQEAAGTSRAGPGQPQSPNEAERQDTTLPAPTQEGTGEPRQVLTLTQAIDTAFRQQP